LITLYSKTIMEAITPENALTRYDAVLQSIQTYDSNPENKFSLLTREVYVYSIKIYQKELFKSLQCKSSSITILQLHQVYDTLFNIALLSINYMDKFSDKTKAQLMEENRSLFQHKNADYGNSFQDFEIVGILVRLNDKINRIIALAGCSNEPQVKDEKMEDTIHDLYNYSLIGLMYKSRPDNTMKQHNN